MARTKHIFDGSLAGLDSRYLEGIKSRWVKSLAEAPAEQDKRDILIMTNFHYMTTNFVGDGNARAGLLFCVSNLALGNDESVRLAHILGGFKGDSIKPEVLLSKLYGLAGSDATGKLLPTLEKTRQNFIRANVIDSTFVAQPN